MKFIIYLLSLVLVTLQVNAENASPGGDPMLMPGKHQLELPRPVVNSSIQSLPYQSSPPKYSPPPQPHMAPPPPPSPNHNQNTVDTANRPQQPVNPDPFRHRSRHPASQRMNNGIPPAAPQAGVN